MTSASTDKLRYRMFYWLLNASLAAIVIGLVSEVIEAFTGYKAFGMSDLAQTMNTSAKGLLVIQVLVPESV